jgi:hypothetical protein
LLSWNSRAGQVNELILMLRLVAKKRMIRDVLPSIAKRMGGGVER